MPAGAQELVGNLLMISAKIAPNDDVTTSNSSSGEVQSLRIRHDPPELDRASDGFTPPGLEELGFA